MEVGSNISLFFRIFGLAYHNAVLDKFMIFNAQYLIFATFLLVVLLALFGSAKEKKSTILAFIGLIIAEVLTRIIHGFYFEPRPFVTYDIAPLIKHAVDAAFPSGHTTVMAVTAWSFTFYKSRFAPLLLILMLIVGFARIFIGVHYPFDIIGGIVLGFISVAAGWQIKNWLFKILF